MIDQTKFLGLTPLGAPSGKTYFQTRKGESIIPLRTETEDGLLSEGDSDPLFNYAPMGTWHRFDIYVDLTKPDGQKIHNWYVDGKKLPRINQYYNSDANLTAVGTIDGFNYLSWLMYQFQGDDNITWAQYMDDAYADLTQARVELSESPTWDEGTQTHKEIQLPTQWGDASIQAVYNQGQFAQGDHVYVYVVHDDGSVNATGYGPVTIGGTPEGFVAAPTGAPVVYGGKVVRR